MRWRWLIKLLRKAPLVPVSTRWGAFETSGVAFSVLDLDASFAFRTATSISFHIAWNGDDHDLEFRKGWIDVHYPCTDDFAARFKVTIRVAVSPPNHDFESREAIIKAILHALSISEDETYEAHFFTPAEQFQVVQPVDRDGRWVSLLQMSSEIEQGEA
jgi:hypothetical protein